MAVSAPLSPVVPGRRVSHRNYNNLDLVPFFCECCEIARGDMVDIVERLIGSGIYSQVFQVLEKGTCRCHALKLARDDADSMHWLRYEVEAVGYLGTVGGIDRSLILGYSARLFGHVRDVLAMDLFGPSVLNVTMARAWIGVDFAFIQAVTRCMLGTFAAFDGIGMVHGDVKPENIL